MRMLGDVRCNTLNISRAALAVPVMLSSLGCGSTAGPRATNTEEIISESPAPSDPTRPQVAQGAIADLAVRLAIAASDIEVVRVEEAVWRDGSIGCAQPGRMYTQALVRGQRARVG
ncbi:hypothetical protein GA0074695_2381 [Micromonospora viridifaciens]|uniref:Uncharacterized protein n=1 Tax=Micromonospora viridifaciens TaxID=1881 RepID=A0A1C4WFF9_MICVI|nr:hypothetical protein [Micromonospora viridifaciens]SCE94924.1 hypothetical protein GA0074695_2381 [Micromonospora viridifaciens]